MQTRRIVSGCHKWNVPDETEVTGDLGLPTQHHHVSNIVISSCHERDTMLSGMQTECGITKYTADFAANKVLSMNKLQHHPLISCSCHSLLLPTLSGCEFVGSSLKLAKLGLVRVGL